MCASKVAITFPSLAPNFCLPFCSTLATVESTTVSSTIIKLVVASTGKTEFLRSFFNY